MGLVMRVAIRVLAAIARMWRGRGRSGSAELPASSDAKPESKAADREECGCPKVTYKMIYTLGIEHPPFHTPDFSCCRDTVNKLEGGEEVLHFYERYKSRAIRSTEKFGKDTYWAVLYKDGVRSETFGNELEIVAYVLRTE